MPICLGRHLVNPPASTGATGATGGIFSARRLLRSHPDLAASRDIQYSSRLAANHLSAYPVGVGGSRHLFLNSSCVKTTDELLRKKSKQV